MSFPRLPAYGLLILLSAVPALAQGIDVPVQPVHLVPPPDAPAAAPSVPTTPSPLKAVKRSDDDLVLLTVRADGTTLAEGTPAYADKGAIYLPLGQITEDIEFPIKLSPTDGTAEGWFYRESNHFSLDAARSEVTIDGTQQAYDRALVEVHEDDIYVERALLEKWFALKIDFSFSSQTVSIAATGSNKLPIEVSGELERKRQMLASRGQTEAKNYPILRSPYEFYSIPFTNVSLTGGYDSSNKTNPASSQVSIESTGDLLYMHSDFFTSYDTTTGRTDNWRMTLSRRDPEGEIFAEDEKIRHTWLGESFHSLKINDVSFGDVYTPDLPLTAKNQSGIGAYISNQPFDRVTQYDHTTVQGNILPNWDVELYRNDELLSFQRAGADGRYNFVDVPLVSGLNILRLVFHGPFAETREETQRIMVSPEISKAGQSYFRMGVLDQGQALSNVVPLSPVSGGASGSNISSNTNHGTRSFFDYEYGLLDNLSLFGQLVQTPSSDTSAAQSYATAGVGASLFGVYGRVDGSQSSLGGKAVQLMAQTNLAGVSLTGKHQIFDNFLSDYTSSLSDPIIRFSEMRADSPFDVSWLPRFNLSVSGSRTEYKDGQTQDQLTQTTSTSLASLAVSNSLIFQDIYGGTLTETTTTPYNTTLSTLASFGNTSTTTTTLTSGTTGNATLSLPVFGINLRGEFGYELAPHFNPETVALTLDKNLSSNTNLRGEVSRDMTNSNLMTYLLGFNRSFDMFKLGVNGSYDTQKQAAGFVNLTFSFGHAPAPDDSWHMFGNDTARDGIVTARAFIDKNNSGVFEEGDEPLPNVIIHSDGGVSGTTDENGFAVLTGQRSNGKSNISVDQTSLGNPSWIVENEGYAAITRPGTPMHIDFPVADSGEIDGTVYLLKGDGTKTVASNVLLQLVADDGTVSREARSSFDGYYILERVKKGHYSLRVSPDQLGRRNLKSNAAIDVTIKGEETALSGIDFVLSKQ